MPYKRLVRSRRVGFLLRNSLMSAPENSNITLSLRPKIQRPHARALRTQKTHLEWNPNTLLLKSHNWSPCTHPWSLQPIQGAPGSSLECKVFNTSHHLKTCWWLMAPYLAPKEIQSPHFKAVHGLGSSYISDHISYHALQVSPVIRVSSNTPNMLFLSGMFFPMSPEGFLLYFILSFAQISHNQRKRPRPLLSVTPPCYSVTPYSALFFFTEPSRLNIGGLM